MSQQQVRVIGTNGQLSLGKEFAGKMVLIDQVDEGIWIIKAGEFVPTSEKWLYKNNNMQKLEKAIVWAENNKPVENFAKFVKRVENGKD